jgi:hypothetical protein
MAQARQGVDPQRRPGFQHEPDGEGLYPDYVYAGDEGRRIVRVSPKFRVNLAKARNLRKVIV